MTPDCPVCLAPLAVLPCHACHACGRMFHTVCADRWRVSCPVCRALWGGVREPEPEPCDRSSCSDSGDDPGSPGACVYLSDSSTSSSS